jgi:hypothetical protein
MEPEGSLLHSQVPVSMLSQLNPVQTPTSHFLKFYLNIIIPSMPDKLNIHISLLILQAVYLICTHFGILNENIT